MKRKYTYYVNRRDYYEVEAESNHEAREILENCADLADYNVTDKFGLEQPEFTFLKDNRPRMY